MSTPHIEVKKDIDHIRLRPGMYIGATYDPNHLLQEIVDNALDELINNYANNISIFFISDSHVVVTDNGRGIPVHEIELEGGIKELSLVTASTRLKSGAKFDNDAYNISIGLHGIGLVAVNALSKQMRISVKNNNIIHDVYFINAELQSYNTYDINTIEKVDWSTRIEFEVDPQYFTIPSFNKNKFLDQLKLTSAKFPNSTLILDNNIIKIPSMESLVREKLELDESIPLIHYTFNTTTNVKSYKIDENNKTIVINIPHEVNFDIYFTYDLESAMSSIMYGDINLRYCSGRYLNNFCSLFSKCIVDRYENLTKNEALSNFRLYISAMIPDPEFDSQSKTNMSKDLKYLFEKDRENLYILTGNYHIKQFITELIERKSLKKLNKKSKTKKTRVSSKNPLVDCLKIPGKTLWVLEGDSAMGGLLQIRNVREEGIYPLTGKILNVVTKNINQIADSKKFKYLAEALGADIGNKNQTDYRFDEIKILCDADPDGHHIVVLMLMIIWFYFPNFIKNKKTTVIIPPLYGAYNNKKFIPIYSAAEAAKYKTYRRYKGIGEMNSNELEVIIRGGGIEYIPEPPNKRQEELLIACINDTELKRGLCLEKEKFSLEKLFPKS